MISEAQRRHLHDQAEQAMDGDAAETLMSYLPPDGWHHLATRHDVQMAEHRLESLIHKAELRLFRAYWTGTVALVIGLSSVPRIAEGLFG